MPPGRPAIPVDLRVVSGNTGHIAKAELERRRQAEIRLGEGKYRMPAEVKRVPRARAKWRELAKLYDGFSFVSSADVDILARYCLVRASYLELEDQLQGLPDRYDAALAAARAEGDVFQVLKVQSAQGAEERQIGRAINARAGVLVALEDRLFLNPRARIQGITKREAPKQADPLEEKGFGNV